MDKIDYKANKRQEEKDKRDDLLFGIEFDIVDALKQVEELTVEHGTLKFQQLKTITKSLMDKIKEL